MTQIVMPYMTEGIAKHVPEFEAWRWAFFLPGCLYIVITLLILVLGQVRASYKFRVPRGQRSLYSNADCTVSKLVDSSQRMQSVSCRANSSITLLDSRSYICSC